MISSATQNQELTNTPNHFITTMESAFVCGFD